MSFLFFFCDFSADFWGFRPRFGPGDPENRVRRAILRRLVVGELRRMIFKRFYAKLRKKVVRKVFRFTTIVLFGRILATENHRNNKEKSKEHQATLCQLAQNIGTQSIPVHYNIFKTAQGVLGENGTLCNFLKTAYK